MPELRDRFTMRAITGEITPIHRDNRLDGRVLDEQIDFVDDKIRCLIPLTDAG